MGYTMKIRLKHSFSRAYDVEVEYQVDEAKKIVEIQADSFDASLFKSFVLRYLAEKGIDAVTDDNKKGSSPDYKIFLTMAGLRFRLETYKLVTAGPYDEYTTVLTPVLNHDK